MGRRYQTDMLPEDVVKPFAQTRPAATNIEKLRSRFRAPGLLHSLIQSRILFSQLGAENNVPGR